MQHPSIRSRALSAITLACAVAMTALAGAALPAASASTPPPAAPAAVSHDGIGIVAGNATYQSRRTGGSALYDPVSDKTYVAWSGNGMDVYVRAFSHADMSWDAAVKVADWDRPVANAYHDYTMLEMLPNGRLAVFVAQHTSSLTMFTAPTAHDAAGTWSRSVISTDKTTYPEPVVLGSDVYVFYSHNTDLSWPYRSYRYIKSGNNGATWSSPTTIIDTGRTPDRFSEVYALSADRVDDRACFTWTLAGGLHHNAQARDLYAACFDPQAGSMTTLTGQDLGATINAAEHAIARVIDAPTTAEVPRPINLAALTRDPASGEFLVGAGYYKNGVRRIDVGRVGPSTGITWTAVDTQSRYFLDLTWNAEASAAEVLSTDGTQAQVRTHLVASGTSQLHSEALIPYGNTGANTVWVANFVEDRQDISYVGYTINAASRDSDYGGSWPVFAGWSTPPAFDEVAEGRPAVASSVKNSNPDRSANKAVDGTSATRWGSEYVDDSWLQVDLGVTMTIDSVLLNWEAAYGRSYAIQVSDDGLSWKTVRTVAGGDGGIDELADLDAEGRYIRMQGLERGTAYGYSLWDFNVYGAPVDLARARPTTASSVAGDNPWRSAQNATDGHSGTRWASAYADPSWIQVDLGAPMEISAVVLDWEAAYGRSYRVQVSDDAAVWSTVRQTSTGAGGREVIEGLTAHGRYVRMLGEQRATPYGYSLWGLEVNGTRAQ